MSNHLRSHLKRKPNMMDEISARIAQHERTTATQMNATFAAKMEPYRVHLRKAIPDLIECYRLNPPLDWVEYTWVTIGSRRSVCWIVAEWERSASYFDPTRVIALLPDGKLITCLFGGGRDADFTVVTFVQYEGLENLPATHHEFVVMSVFIGVVERLAKVSDEMMNKWGPIFKEHLKRWPGDNLVS